jgi:2-polyprenyl-6-methoxyphenol hydroxylase-like FAD-dependent oxidoreductase
MAARATSKGGGVMARERPQTILIIGGGIAGLVLACRLQAGGLEPVVIERAPGWTPKGSGIHLYSNALRALDVIAVADDIVARGRGHDDYEYADPTDRHVVRVTYPRLARSDLPALATITRQALHDILIARATALGVRLELGMTAEIAVLGDDGADMQFSDGRAARFDIVVAADGIYSGMRSALFGETAPVYTGQAIWRAVLERHPETTCPKIMFAGAGRMFGVVPVNDRQIYLLAGMPDPDRPRHDPARYHELIRQHFASFRGLASFYLDQIKAPDQVVYTAIEMVEQPPPWFKGPVFLIGDAAHASPPYLAQGAAMAIEDAVVLGELLLAGGTLADMQTAYMDRRFERACFIQRLSLERNKQRYQGAGYGADEGGKSARIRYLEDNAQREIDELYAELAKPI